MNAEEMWAAWGKGGGAPYEAWAFGDDPDELARLVAAGVKTATSSAFPLYEIEGEDPPRAGEYSVILNGRDEAVCVIRTARVRVVPFSEVGEDFASLEGEGDRTLRYWRDVHRRFFTKCMREAGLSFTEDMPVVCEEFDVVYKPEEDAQ